MPHVLLIDDELKITAPLRESFERDGYQVTVASDGYTGLSMAMVGHPDVIVVDIMMPGLNGWQVVRALREHVVTPIIILTALGDPTDRVQGLELGADDYLVKPFTYKAIEAHVRAMLRRVRYDAGSQPARRIEAGGIVLDLDAHIVTRNGEPVCLRPKEYEILALLMTHLNKVVTREQLFDEVWGTDWLGDTRTLDVHISWLRAKLETDPAKPVYLHTVRGVGYRFVSP